MDSESLANTINGLGRNDFKKVVFLFLSKAFNFVPMNQDGQYDGGSDWALFKDTGGTLTIAVQDTVQKSDWYEKAIENAKTSIDKHKITRYFFLTNRNRSAITLRQLESDITTNYRIPATCLGGKEIADFLDEHNLLSEFLDAIDAPLAYGIAKRPDKQEVTLYTYAILSKDSTDLRETVYDDTILIVLYENNKMDEKLLIEAATQLLGSNTLKERAISGRISSLLTRGKILKNSEGTLELSPLIKKDLEIAERTYQKEFASLTSAQINLIEQKGGVQWTEDQCKVISVLVARAFVCNQISTAKSSKAKLTALGLFDYSGDPIQEIRDFLKDNGVPIRKIQEIIEELIDQACDLPIIKKLSRAAIFVALEGTNPISSVKSIGASRWSDVKIMVDASVAIPFLCASLYKPTHDRFSSSNFHIIDSLKKLSANLRIPHYYINECASHLLRALNYKGLDEYAEKLTYSQNAYVAHYYQLKNSGHSVPDTITEYLCTFSSACLAPQSSMTGWARKVMTHLQPLLKEYGIDFEYIDKINDVYLRDIQIEYTYQLQQFHRKKSETLIDHDVKVLAHIKRQISEQYEHWVTLSWDKAIISVGKRFDDIGLVVNPEVISDFIQTSRPISDTQLCSLAHSLAKTKNEPLAISAQVIDRVILFASDKLQDWEFRKQINQFTDNILERINFDDVNTPSWVDRETDDFLEGLGIKLANLDEFDKINGSS